MRWRALLVALLTGGVVSVPASAAHGADGPAFAFADARITESSGLVDLGPTMVTTNDSGSRSRLFVVNAASGRTVGVTSYRAGTLDVEALAPAGGGAVWVGDIGDNRGSRTSVSVHRVKVGPGRTSPRATRYRLAYPGGARDAESLFVDRGGRLHVVSKSFLGGVVYRAPARLSRTRVNRLERVARVVEFATDAAMLPDGRHVIVRGPGRASVYTFPGFQRLGTFALPRQRQGEGISVGPTGRIRLSSEGARSVVHQVSLPPAVAQRVRPPAAAPRPVPSTSPSGSPAASPAASPSAPGPAMATASPGPAQALPPADRDRAGLELPDPWLMWSILGVIAVGAAGIGLGLRRRQE